MAKQHIVHAAAASGLALSILPALADEDQGISLTLGVEQKFEAGDNLSLDRPEEGNTTLSTTSLTLGLESETATQSLSATAGVKLREGSLPTNSDTSTGIVEPELKFSYQRDAANAEITVNGRYRESDITFTDSLADFADDTGIIILPPDFENLDGDGTRRNYSLKAKLETGADAPLGFEFDASVSGISYSDQAASLEDIFRYSFGARANLRFNRVSTGFASYKLSHYESDDIEDTERDTHSFEVGLKQEISEIAAVEAAVSYVEIEEEFLGGTITDTTSGVAGRLSFSMEVPDGEYTASYNLSRDQNGERHEVEVGRTKELPNGLLSATIGASKKGSSSPSLIGSLNYTQDLPTGSLRVGVNRQVSVDSDDNERVATSASMSYDHEINNISSIGLDLSFGMTEGTATTAETSSAKVSASYNRDITEDWSLSTGVSYRVRDQERDGKTDSTSVFLTLQREFTLFR